MRLYAFGIVLLALALAACAPAPASSSPAQATAVQAPTNAPAAAPSLTQNTPAPTAAPATSAPMSTAMPNMPTPASSQTSQPGGGATNKVSLKDLAFNPNSITVKVGTTVTWTNDETGGIQHTVTSGAPNAPSGVFDSGTLNPGQSFQFTFRNPGTFTYFCKIHGAAMTGTVVVTQ